MRARRYVLIFFATLVGISLMFECEASSIPESTISVPELKEVFKSQDEMSIIRAMNRVKQSQQSRDLMLFVLKLWTNEKSGLSDLPWDLLNSDPIRIEVANVLAQASNNDLIKVDRGEIRTFAIKVISRSGPHAQAVAIGTLGLLRNPADIDLIRKIALEEEPSTFWAAIIALAQNCDPLANAALVDIKSRVSRKESKKFLKESSNFLSGYRYRCE